MATAGMVTTIGTTSAGATRTATDGPPRQLYSCDITTERDPTPDVNDRLDIRRVEGTFDPTEADCFEERTLLYRYLFTTVKGGKRGLEGIAWATRERLPPGEFRIATIFVCNDAPSGYCARQPFYGIVVRRVAKHSSD
jgi:hypothetical protein